MSSVPGVEASREPHQMITVLSPQGVDKVQVGAISTQHRILTVPHPRLNVLHPRLDVPHPRLNVPHPLSNSACSDKCTGDTQ